MEKLKICQSCGMPIKKEEDSGTDKDRSKNKEFCKFCFQNGSFTDEGITLENKIIKNIEMAKKMGINEKQAKELAEKVIPKLKRWNKKI